MARTKRKAKRRVAPRATELREREVRETLIFIKGQLDALRREVFHLRELLLAGVRQAR